MDFSLAHSIEILRSTPEILIHYSAHLSDEWIHSNEGEDTWSVYDVIGHLIHGEKTDWIPRMEIILSEVTEKSFTPFDRFAQFKDSKGKSIHDLLAEFRDLREENIRILISKNISEDDLEKTGIHPAFGRVSLSQLIATWTVHDLNHIAQISRVLASQYNQAVGPWKEYLRILND